MSGEQQIVKAKEHEKEYEEKHESPRQKSAAEFVEFLAICLDEGWSPTECPENCSVEPDGICPHGFRSVALELGLI